MCELTDDQLLEIETYCFLKELIRRIARAMVDCQKGGETMAKTKYAVVVRYCDIWGEEHEKEIPCNDKAHMAKLEQQLKMTYKHDPTVSSYVVITVCRKG